jgi:hypothetical protein
VQALAVISSRTYRGVSGISGRTIGWALSVDSSIVVTDPRYYVHGGDGLLGWHEVGTWSAGFLLLTSATLQPADPLADRFRYTAITPISLDARTAYVVGTLSDGSAAYGGTVPFPHITIDASLDFVTGRRLRGVRGLPRPTHMLGGSPSLFVPNLQIGDPIPEPRTRLLFDHGLAGSTALRRRNRPRKW